MTIHNLEKIFRPSSVAVLKAGEGSEEVFKALVENVKNGGFEGRILPVSSDSREIAGLSTYGSLGELGAVDLALIAASIDSAPPLVEECAQAGVGGVLIVSAGGREREESGCALEERINRAASGSCMRIIGPDCFGFQSGAAKLNAGLSGQMALSGRMALVSQSGTICNALLDLSIRDRVGFRYFISLGGMLNVDFADIINYLGNDTEVDSIVLYIEKLGNIRKFMSAARAVSRLKPIIVLKSGRFGRGARASYAEAPCDEDCVYDAAFKRAGIVRVETIEELFDCAELTARQVRPKGPRLAVLTNAAGPGLMALDALLTRGLEPAVLANKTLDELDKLLPPCWGRANPVDILSDATPERFLAAAQICIAAPEVDGLLIILAPQPLSDPTAVATGLSEALKNKRVSVFTVFMGASHVEGGRKILRQAGIPTYETAERAVSAFAGIYSYKQNLEMLQEVPPKLPRELKFDRARAWDLIEEALERENRSLTEVEAKAILSSYGIPVNPTRSARSEEEAVSVARETGYPVALKIYSRDIARKSDVGGVLLDLKKDDEVRRGFHLLFERAAAYAPMASIEGVSLQPMIPEPQCRLIIGSRRDPGFGPVIFFGTGGAMSEIIMDRATALPPLNRLLARRLMESTRIYRFLSAPGARSGADLVHLEEILIRFSQLITDFPEIVELEINPLLLSGGRFIAADAGALLEPSPVASPMHLVISPYPGEYEQKITVKGGIDILLRPIKPEDAPLLIDLFDTLSASSIYFRFFSPLRSLPHNMLARFTQIDYDRDVVLVAIEQRNAGERMLGVARLMGDPDVTHAEFAIVVGDPWHGSGVGAALLERCISIGRERGLEFIWGFVLPENSSMLGLGRKLGFKISRAEGGTAYELRIDLKPRREGETCPRVF